MIIRFVEMTFRPDSVAEFLEMFDTVADRIRQSRGCHALSLLSSVEHEGVFVTYSVWDDEECLHGYRNSDFFRETWTRTRKFFSAPPRARSYEVARGDTPFIAM